jgi:hypothetical protein
MLDSRLLGRWDGFVLLNYCFTYLGGKTRGTAVVRYNCFTYFGGKTRGTAVVR